MSMKISKPRVRVVVNLEEFVAEKLRKLAAQGGLTMTGMIRELIASAQLHRGRPRGKSA